MLCPCCVVSIWCYKVLGIVVTLPVVVEVVMVLLLNFQVWMVNNDSYEWWFLWHLRSYKILYLTLTIYMNEHESMVNMQLSCACKALLYPHPSVNFEAVIVAHWWTTAYYIKLHFSEKSSNVSPWLHSLLNL